MYAGCGDGNILGIDIPKGASGTIGMHNGLVKNLFLIEELQIVVSVGNDKSIKLWDSRQGYKPIFEIKLLYKPLCADIFYPIMALGLEKDKSLVFDLKQTIISNYLFQNSEEFIASPLNSILTTVAIQPDKKKVILGAADGRIGQLNILDRSNSPSYQTKETCNFKCHKVDVDGKVRYYSVNSMRFHQIYDFLLVTSGGDGVTYYWNINDKMKITNYQYNKVPITKTAFSPDGKVCAYALGYDWSEGIWGIKYGYPNQIYAHILQSTDVKSSS